MQRPRPETVTLDDVVITEELSRRSPRSPNWQAEAQAMQSLARQMASNSETLLQSLVDMALHLCSAGSAGVSELSTTENGEEVFGWTVLAGKEARSVGQITRRDFSPCGVCLDRGNLQLFGYPDRYFTYLQEANTPIVEGLVLPLIADSRSLGTIWIMSQDENRHFDSEDVRIMTSLADFTATALLLKQRQTGELLAANADLEVEIVERKQTEEKLGDVQRRLELSLTGADLGTWTYRVGTDEFWADDRALQMHGHEPHEVHTFAEAGANIHPEDRDRAGAAFAQVIQDRSKLQIEYRVVWRDGSVRWIASYAEFIASGDRDEGMFYGVVQDISDRKFTEAALYESEARSRVPIENLPGGAAFVVDRDLRYLLAEGEALHAADFNPEDLVGKTIFEAMPPELTTQYEKLYRQALAGESFEHEHDAHNRSYISRGTPLRSPNGEVYAVLAISYDITDRKQAEAAIAADLEDTQRLRELSARLVAEDDIQTLYQEIVATAIALTRADAGTVQILDEATQELVMLANQGAGQKLTEHFYRVNADSNTPCGMALTTGKRTFIDFDVPESEDSDGSMRLHVEEGYLSAQSTPLFTRSGKAIGMVSTHWRKHHRPSDRELRFLDLLTRQAADLIEQRQAQIALRESEEKFRAFVSAASDIIYEMSADWREMLSLKGKAFIATTENPRSDWMEAYIPETDKPRVRAEIDRAIETRSNFELEHRVIRLDGTVGWTFSRTIPLLNETGEIVKWFGAASDITEQKQAEAALRGSEERFRTLANTAPALIWFNDAQGNNRFINQHFLDFTGKSAEQIRGEGWYELVHPDDAELYIADYLATICEQRSWHNRNRIRRHDGVWRWHDNYAQPLFSADGIYLGHVGVTIDNTDAIEAEIALRKSDRRQEFVLKLSDALRPLSDPVQIQNQASRLLGEHLGVDRAYYVEINVAENYARVHQDYLRGDSPTLVGIHQFTDFGWIVPHLQRGETAIVEDTQSADIVPDGDRAAMAAIRIVSHISLPLIEAGTLVGALCVTESVQRQWSAAEVELVRETAERIWATIIRIRAEESLRESEIQRVREQSAREQERQRADALAELDRAKTTFFSNVSHEFRTPLTLLLAPLQDALSDRTHPLASAHRERLELAHRNTNRLLKLVNTLLDFSRIEAGRMEAVYEPTDLAMFTTELASVFRSAIERAGLRLRVDCPPLPEPVYVDREMWEKIVLNLLSNAFKFTLEGEIAVRLHRADGDGRDLAFRLRHRVRLQIQDTGTGIAPEELPHLFERFYQIRGAKARTHEGSGIGLALVYELIRLHGGSVDVSSVVGQGTCFTVTIPFGTAHLSSDRLRLDVGDRNTTPRTLASTAIGAAPYVEEAEGWLTDAGSREQGAGSREKSMPAHHSPLTTHHSARVLLVDDNADMRSYLTRILSEYVQVEAVADGATALAVAQARVPDLILSDVMMPGLDGFELLRALRADPNTREVPIILLSARAGEEAIVSGLEAGADDYLIKPFSAQELVSRVNAHLQMAQLRCQALQEARTTIRSRDELLSTVSHELNTPLVSILGWTRLLRSHHPSESMLTKALDTIERNATLQAKLVQDLLDISRIEAGKLRLNQEPIQLKPIIETAISTVAASAAAKGVDLVWHETTADPRTHSVTIVGDGDRLGQVFCNLLTNAIKFTPESGSVRVELSAIDDDSSSHTPYAQIRVSDTGIGIPTDFLPHIFDRFRQAAGATSVKGLGLGLAIARHLVELHNGTIHAQSAGVGQGATFTVRLPLLQDDRIV